MSAFVDMHRDRFGVEPIYWGARWGRIRPPGPWHAAANGTTIRRAVLGDEDGLRELDLRSWSTEVTPASRVELRKSFFTADCGPDDVLVADDDGALAGYAKLAPPTPLAASRHVLEIRGLAVDPVRRRRGIATRLLQAAAHEAAQRDVRRLTLRVLANNGAARRLYEGNGYAVEGVLRGEFKLDGTYVDDVLMALELPCATS